MTISILIPCYNEEKSIRKCVQSCLDQTRKLDQILVVNDGSTDKSLQILKSFKKKIEILNLHPATGNKSYAQEEGLKLIKGDIVVTTDGDTIIDKNFVNLIENDFLDPQVTAVCGVVKSLKYNWLTAYRAFDYSISTNLHKLAQSHLGFILVIPGAAGAFRTKIFKEFIGFDHDTLTEDLDFTYKLHKFGLKIKYDKDAIVYTQDPANLASYINQMRRWFSGGWQNLKKHFNLDLFYHPGRSLELSLIYLEGLVFSIMLFLVPLINFVFALKLLALYMVLVIVQAIYASVKEKRLDLLQVIVFYPIMMYINAWVFLEQFIKEIILRKKNLVWFHAERVSI